MSRITALYAHDVYDIYNIRLRPDESRSKKTAGGISGINNPRLSTGSTCEVSRQERGNFGLSRALQSESLTLRRSFLGIIDGMEESLPQHPRAQHTLTDPATI